MAIDKHPTYKFLSCKQKEIAKIAEVQGNITFPQISAFYSEQKNAVNAVKRLIKLKWVVQSENPQVLIWNFPEVINATDPQTRLGGIIESEAEQ